MTITPSGKSSASVQSVLDINLIKTEQLIDLREQGWTAEKAEGICMTDENSIAVINDNDFGIVTKITDEANPETNITDYIYQNSTKTYTFNGKDAAPVISIQENTETSQLWIFEE